MQYIVIPIKTKECKHVKNTMVTLQDVCVKCGRFYQSSLFFGAGHLLTGIQQKVYVEKFIHTLLGACRT